MLGSLSVCRIPVEIIIVGLGLRGVGGEVDAVGQYAPYDGFHAVIGAGVRPPEARAPRVVAVVDGVWLVGIVACGQRGEDVGVPFDQVDAEHPAVAGRIQFVFGCGDDAELGVFQHSVGTFVSFRVLPASGGRVVATSDGAGGCVRVVHALDECSGQSYCPVA